MTDGPLRCFPIINTCHAVRSTNCWWSWFSFSQEYYYCYSNKTFVEQWEKQQIEAIRWRKLWYYSYIFYRLFQRSSHMIELCVEHLPHSFVYRIFILFTHDAVKSPSYIDTHLYWKRLRIRVTNYYLNHQSYFYEKNSHFDFFKTIVS